MDLADMVAAALERGMLPAVIARGAGLRVAAVEDGVAVLEVTGSPGAVLPLASRIEAPIRAAVPEITGVRITGPGAGPPESAAGSLAERARRVLDAEINPVIAAHRGHAALAGVDHGWVRIRFEGGCQGCSLAEVTLRQGIEPLLRTRLPDMTGLVDVQAGVIEGISRTGRLVTGAALILFFAFAALSAWPETDLKVAATALGTGILLDATVVRGLLVPALVAVLGQWNWWLPRRAGRLLRVPAPRPGGGTESPLRTATGTWPRERSR